MSANNDAAFLRMFMIVLGALVAFTVAILLLANRITGVVDEERGEDPRLRAAVIERIRPVGSVAVAAAAPAGAGGEAAPVEASSGPVDAAKDNIEEPAAGIDYAESYPTDDPTVLYYWRSTYWRRLVS